VHNSRWTLTYLPAIFYGRDGDNGKEKILYGYEDTGQWLLLCAMCEE